MPLMAAEDVELDAIVCEHGPEDLCGGPVLGHWRLPGFTAL